MIKVYFISCKHFLGRSHKEIYNSNKNNIIPYCYKLKKDLSDSTCYNCDVRVKYYKKKEEESKSLDKNI